MESRLQHLALQREKTRDHPCRYIMNAGFSEILLWHLFIPSKSISHLKQSPTNAEWTCSYRLLLRIRHLNWRWRRYDGLRRSSILPALILEREIGARRRPEGAISVEDRDICVVHEARGVKTWK